jgi:hypothetical protein
MRRMGGLAALAGLVGALAAAAPASADPAQAAAHVQIDAQAAAIAQRHRAMGRLDVGYSDPPEYMWAFNGSWYGRVWVSSFNPANGRFSLNVYDCGAWLGCDYRPDLSSHS